MAWPDSPRNAPTGPGSRGGRWHEPEYRHAYQRAWRLAHPEYRDREALRRMRARAMIRGDDPALITGPAGTRRWPVVVADCTCSCGCRAEIVRVCGMCRQELHA